VAADRFQGEGGVSVGGVITIVGGGWSVGQVNCDRLVGHVIAVNDSARHLPWWNTAVSMDRLWTENRWDELVERSIIENGEVWLRRSAVQNITTPAPRPWFHIFECDHTRNEFTARPGVLNGTNSGACALNLAWQMKPARLYLLGFDMNRSDDGRAYWYPPYPWSSKAGGTSAGKYSTWAAQFDQAAQSFAQIGCDVFNVSPRSAITSFRKITPRQYLEVPL
jgi:hypothetical protein